MNRLLSRWLILALVPCFPAVVQAADEAAPSAEPAAAPEKAAAPKTAAAPGKTLEVAAPEAEQDALDEPTPGDTEADAWKTAEATHRGGFTVGLAAAAGLGASNGFPNDSKKIGRASYYTESGLGLAPSSALWIGGTYDDFLTFGVGGGFTTILNADTVSPAPLMFFHVDLFPLFPLGGQWKNVGIMSEFGLGFPKTNDAETDAVLIDGAGSSFLFAGGFWEGIEAWKLKMGPYAGLHYMFSQTIRRPVAALGFRISLYTDP